MILYLDFDGVLHADCAYRTKHGILLKGPGTLFQYAAGLAAVLEPHPEIQIVLSTSWVRELGFDKAKSHLPVPLQDRVIGATYHSAFESRNSPWFEVDAGTAWLSLTRYQQIARHVARHNITDWLALDDDNEGWPAEKNHRLMHTAGESGLNEAAVAALRAVLENRCEAVDTSCARFKQ